MLYSFHLHPFQNVSIAIVGKDHPFDIFEGGDIDSYLSAIEGEERRGGQAAAPADEEAGEQAEEGAMETEDPWRGLPDMQNTNVISTRP